MNQRARELRARILKLVLQNAPPNYAQLMQLWRQWRYEVTR